MSDLSPLEVKAELDGDPSVRQALGTFLNAFEDFKDANDERLKEVEKRGVADGVLRDKVDRLNTALDRQQRTLDQLALKAARPGRERSDERSPLSGEDDERKSAFLRFVRTGDAAAMGALDIKSLDATSDPDGGILAPIETERQVTARMATLSPMRSVASVREIGSNVYRRPVSRGGMAAGWVSETGARPETATAQLAAIDFPTMELYAMPAASQTLLDDSVVDIEQWLADEVQTEFAAQESAAFINGNGTTQPKGILSYSINDEASHAHGTIGAINTGTDAGFDVDNPADALLDLIYTPKSVYRTNGRFLMNRSVIGQVRKFKDADGNYIWQPATGAGETATLFGYPVSECEDMPGISAGSPSVAFGDFSRGYLVVDRVGLRVLRDPYSAKPYILFYTTKRVGGGVQEFDAIKVLRFSA